MATLQESRHMVTSHSSTGHALDNNLDALLDDLQTSVSRPGHGTVSSLSHNQNSSVMNGGHRVPLPPGATGYREVTTTVTQEQNGVPMTSRDYQIEYLSPANSVTVAQERSSSPALDLLKSTDTSGKNLSSYRTEKYEYQVRSSNNNIESKNTYIPTENIDKTYYTDSNRQYVNESRNLNRNLNELDVLLKELDTQKNSGYTSTPNPPRRTEHVSRMVETRVERNTATSPGRTYIDAPSSPIQARRSHSANRELVYNESSAPRASRAASPGVSPGGVPKIPQRTVNVQREVNTIESRSHTSRRDSPSNRDVTGELSPTLRRRTPSPSGEFRPANFSGYPISPKETSMRTVVKNTYNTYNTTTSARGTPTPTSFDDQQPYRSPSPVSFPQKRSPSPVRRSLNRTDSGRTLATSNYQVSSHPQHQLSDPNSPTVITYKYSSQSTQHNRYPGGYEEPHMPRPFPTASPIHGGEQSPPKKLDELMASFHDSRNTSYRQEYYNSNQQYHQSETTDNNNTRYNTDLQRSPSFERNLRPSNVKATQVYNHNQTQQQESQTVLPPQQQPPPPAQERPLTKSVAGTPVYYPPGVELFAKKEEAQMEQQYAGGKGKAKAKGKMKYKYERSEKSKEKSSTGVAAVPVCLPLCCAMPCVIM